MCCFTGTKISTYWQKFYHQMGGIYRKNIISRITLYNHFPKASNNIKRESKERAKYTGRILTAIEFITNLGK